MRDFKSCSWGNHQHKQDLTSVKNEEEEMASKILLEKISVHRSNSERVLGGKEKE